MTAVITPLPRFLPVMASELAYRHKPWTFSQIVIELNLSHLPAHCAGIFFVFFRLFACFSPWPRHGCQTNYYAILTALFCKQLAHVLEGFEFQRIATGIEQKHRALFPNLSLESDIGFYHKFNVMPL